MVALYIQVPVYYVTECSLVLLCHYSLSFLRLNYDLQIIVYHLFLFSTALGWILRHIFFVLFGCLGVQKDTILSVLMDLFPLLDVPHCCLLVSCNKPYHSPVVEYFPWTGCMQGSKVVYT